MSSKTHLRMSTFDKARDTQPRDATAEDALLQLQAFHHLQWEATSLFLMAVRQGATDAQIANELRQGLPHLTYPASLQVRRAGKQPAGTGTTEKGQQPDRMQSGLQEQCCSPQSRRQSDQRCWGRESCRSAGAVRRAGSPRTLKQSDRDSRSREPCNSAEAVRIASSSQSLQQCYRHRRDRESCRSVGTVCSAGLPQSRRQ